MHIGASPLVLQASASAAARLKIIQLSTQPCVCCGAAQCALHAADRAARHRIDIVQPTLAAAPPPPVVPPVVHGALDKFRTWGAQIPPGLCNIATQCLQGNFGTTGHFALRCS